MKTIIAGSRSIEDYNILLEAIKDSAFDITEIVSGGAKGVDYLGEVYAYQNNLPCKIFKAYWNSLGKSAGILRNIEMAEYSNSLIALWDGISPGTKHMIETATKKGLKVYVKNLSLSL